MAIQSELQPKFAEGYEFETVVANLDSPKVMKGVWIFETEANSDTTAINFNATWVNNDSTKITTVAYKSTIAGMTLTGVNVTKVDKPPESPTKLSKSTFSACAPLPYSPTTYVPPENKSCCSQCNKQHRI